MTNRKTDSKTPAAAKGAKTPADAPQAAVDTNTADTNTESAGISADAAPADAPATATSNPETGGPAEAPAAETAPADPFAHLQTITLGDAQNVLDMSGEATSPARKYQKVHDDAVGGKMPVMRGWKHTTAMFVLGHNKGPDGGRKPGSVYGTIAEIVRAAGKGGISAYELCTELRKRQIGNKRSHYCTQLPPVGWAEGWVNTAVNKSIINVHATKKAPALTVAQTAASGTEATPEQNAAAITDAKQAA